MATSYNGWPASSSPSSIGVVPFGDQYGLPFPGGVRTGDVYTVLGYVAVQLHNRVEKAIGGWTWGYDYRPNVNNPTQLSNHASATAIDWNAPNHPNGARGTFTSAQVAVIRQILAEVGNSVRWGGDYSGTPDEMHFEINVNASTLAGVAAKINGGITPTPPNPGPSPIPPGTWNEDESDMIVGQDQKTGRIWLVSGNTKLEFPTGGGSNPNSPGKGNLYADLICAMTGQPALVAMNNDVLTRIPTKRNPD